MLYFPIDENFEVLTEGPCEGDLLALKQRNDKSLIGRWVPYETQDPNIFPIAVSGITKYHSSLLIGKRDRVKTFSGCWELAPSGGIDPSSLCGGLIDYRGHLLKELEEETGIGSKDVNKITPLLVVYDPKAALIDICLEIIVTTDQLRTNGEYSDLFWVRCDQLDQIKGDWVPLSKSLLKRFYSKS